MEKIRRRLQGSDDGEPADGADPRRVPGDGLAAVDAACAEALAHGVASADVVLNILARARDPAPALTIMTPDRAQARTRAVADCHRYDSLRRIA